jgi:hypothetical protein
VEGLIVLGLIAIIVISIRLLWRDHVKHELATGVPAPRRITSDDFEIVRREASCIEQESVAAVNGKYNGGPIITLVSGERLMVEEVLLYDVNKVAAAATDSACRCQGCGCKGGPGWRGQNGQCVSHANLTKDCGSPPSTRCTYEGAQQVCRRG